MSTQTKSEYLLIFRGTDWHKGLSPEEIQQVMTQAYAWFERLLAEGKCKGGHPLENNGKVVRGGKTVIDGPFAESKETIAGYILILADSLEEAVEIAKECPTLEYGETVEVRPVAPECPVFEVLRQKSVGEEFIQTNA